MFKPRIDRRRLVAAGAVVLLLLGLAISMAVYSDGRSGTSSSYTVLAWNDLGMHCISPRFAQMAILPPYNNLMVQVIKRGDEPQLVTSGITVSYSFPQNTTTVGKTDFWTYAQALFGVALPQGKGLTGNGLSGNMVFKTSPFPTTRPPAFRCFPTTTIWPGIPTRPP